MIGGDMLLNDYKFTVGSDRELFHVDHNPITWITAMSIMFCMMTGNDANFMDILFDYGIINVILMCLLAAFLNILASYFFICTWRFNFGNQYADIVKDTFGFGHNIVRIIYILTLVYSAIANISSLKSTLDMFINPLYGENTIFTNHYFVFFFITPLFTLPFVFFKKFVSLRFYFMIANFAILIILIGAIYFFVTSYKQDGFDPQKKFVLVSGNFWGLVDQFSAFTTLFWGQPFICNVATALKHTTQRYVFNLVITSTTLVAIFNFSISMFSHFYLWGEAKDNDILGYFPTSNKFTQVMQIASIINILITNAGYLIIASRQFVQLFASEINFISIFVGAIMVIFVCGALDYYYENGYEHIIELIGSITYSFMALLLPPILYIRAFKVKGFKGWSALIHLIVCLAITGLIIKTFV